MKNKTNIKLLFFILALIFLVLAIISIRSTYARYITSLKATSSVEMGSWLILVNNQNIIEDSDLSTKIIPVFNENSQYIAEGKIAPTSTGTVEITVDYSEVTVPFEYEISFSSDSLASLDDFKLIDYSIDDGEAITVEASTKTISSTVNPEETDRTKTFTLNFAWFDGEGESFDDIEDTTFSRNHTDLGLRFDLTFNQLQPTT